MSQLANRKLGDRGEALVAEWLQRQGWMIVAQQWHCRWGELDLVARYPNATLGIAFVEVKTRRRAGIDQGGKLAITPQKQQKLWRSAQQFLVKQPHYSDLPCRFDVALVLQGDRPNGLLKTRHGQPILTLTEYIENAFQVG
ncbi:MAG: YraN family protein [Leptolyngbyaceae cyanobacterium]|mgnify:CR=1 FL=1